MPKKKPFKLDVLIVEHSPLKRKVAIETFRANGYTKGPKRLHHTDHSNHWVMLKKGKVKVRIEWPRTEIFSKKKVARKRR